MIVRPSLDDPAVGELSNLVGGPGGTHARTRRWAPLVVGLLVAASLVALGAGLRAGCTAEGWSTESPDFTPGCFSALPGDYVTGGGAAGLWPYASAIGASTPGPDGLEERYEAGPSHALAGATVLQAAIADLAAPDAATRDERGAASPQALADEQDVRAEAARSLWWAAGLIAVAWAGLVLTVARFRAGSPVGRPWDAVLLAAAPVAFVGGLVDLSLIAVTLASAAVLALRRGSMPLAGAFLGAGLAFGWVAWAVAAALGVVVAARGARFDARVLAAAVATWLLVSLPALLTGPGVWLEGWRRVLDSAGSRGSVHGVVEAVSGGRVPAYTVVALVVLLGWVVALGVILRWRGPALPPRIEQVCLLIVAPAVVLLGSGPSAALAVLPFAVLALPRVWPLLGWQLVEVVYAATLWWTLDGDLMRSDAIVEGPLAAMTLLRVVALLGLTALVVRDVALPSYDVIGAERRTLLAGRS